MLMRRLLASMTVLTPLVLATGQAQGIGFILGETKEELKLKYDVSVQDHGTGRITIVFTLTDEGRLKPLDEVQLAIPDQAKNEYGGHWMDLAVSIDTTRTDGNTRVGRVHILKEWAERAEIRLNTHTMDGKTDPLTRLHHVIRVAKYVKNSTAEPSRPAAAAPAEPPAAAAPATDRKAD